MPRPIQNVARRIDRVLDVTGTRRSQIHLKAIVLINRSVALFGACKDAVRFDASGQYSQGMVVVEQFHFCRESGQLW